MNINNLISDPIYFEEAARKLGFASATIMEKDFWVVWILTQLFSEPVCSENLIFKGGTSLSKVFKLINRFSEDIDLTVARSALGLETPPDDLFGFGSKRRKRFFEELDSKLNQYIKTLIHGICQGSCRLKFSKLLPQKNLWKLYIDPNDQSVAYFEYPRALKQNGYSVTSYIKPRIVLEFGARGAVFPTILRPINTYLESVFPDLKLCARNNIKVLSAERTFWEKATLHYMVCKQPTGKAIKPALARHYYDLVMMHDNNIETSAIQQIDLLKDVIKQKQVFFQNSWVDYKHILSKGIQLIPDTEKLKIIKNDYSSMSEMFFDEPPARDYIVGTLAKLELEINSLI